MPKYLHKEDGKWTTSRRKNASSIPGEHYVVPRHLESEPDEALYLKDMWYDEETETEKEADGTEPEDAHVYKKVFVDETKVSEYEAKQKQNKRNGKLQRLRRIRDTKLKDVDVMVNELQLGLRDDTQAIVDYRQGLLDITASYKDANDESKGTTDLDVYQEDMSDFDGWPVKP